MDTPEPAQHDVDGDDPDALPHVDAHDGEVMPDGDDSVHADAHTVAAPGGDWTGR